MAWGWKQPGFWRHAVTAWPGSIWTKQALAALRANCRAPRGDHLLVPLDITDRPGVRAFRDKVLEKYGRVDTVLSNVGNGFFGAFEELDLEAAFKLVEINLMGAATLLQSFIPG